MVGAAGILANKESPPTKKVCRVNKHTQRNARRTDDIANGFYFLSTYFVYNWYFCVLSYLHCAMAHEQIWRFIEHNKVLVRTFHGLHRSVPRQWTIALECHHWESQTNYPIIGFFWNMNSIYINYLKKQLIFFVQPIYKKFQDWHKLLVQPKPWMPNAVIRGLELKNYFAVGQSFTCGFVN